MSIRVCRTKSIMYYENSETYKWKKFINSYRLSPLLWNRNDPNYKNISKRKVAYKKLLEDLQKIKPKATAKTVVQEIRSLRANYFREEKKVRAAEQRGEIYIPNIWYFVPMSFLETARNRHPYDYFTCRMNAENAPIMPRNTNFEYATDSESSSESDCSSDSTDSESSGSNEVFEDENPAKDAVRTAESAEPQKVEESEPQKVVEESEIESGNETNMSSNDVEKSPNCARTRSQSRAKFQQNAKRKLFSSELYHNEDTDHSSDQLNADGKKNLEGDVPSSVASSENTVTKANPEENKQGKVETNVQANAEGNVQAIEEPSLQANVEDNVQANEKVDVQLNLQANIEKNIEAKVQADHQVNVEPNAQENGPVVIEINFEKDLEQIAQENIQAIVQENIQAIAQENIQTNFQINAEENAQPNGQRSANISSSSNFLPTIETILRPNTQKRVRPKTQGNGQLNTELKGQENIEFNAEVSSSSTSQSFLYRAKNFPVRQQTTAAEEWEYRAPVPFVLIKPEPTESISNVSASAITPAPTPKKPAVASSVILSHHMPNFSDFECSIVATAWSINFGKVEVGQKRHAQKAISDILYGASLSLLNEDLCNDLHQLINAKRRRTS